MTGSRDALHENLRETLQAAAMIAENLAETREIVSRLIPVAGEKLRTLGRPDLVEINTFLLQFLQLAGLLQDKLTRLILHASDEDLTQASRLDMRHLLEKLHALEPAREFGVIAEIRNRLAHDYPLEPNRKAATINEAFARSVDLLAGFDDLRAYSRAKFGL